MQYQNIVLPWHFLVVVKVLLAVSVVALEPELTSAFLFEISL
jgi:hypothetical protein